jgi:hypothetical protein
MNRITVILDFTESTLFCNIYATCININFVIFGKNQIDDKNVWTKQSVGR